ncbi:uncharacterized protein [Palaemon carinicauda]|uniref:uncharacterized protein n=1 Tax=Palaemon carinicauda TaxID=392227 RepID=UPI0035B6917E
MADDEFIYTDMNCYGCPYGILGLKPDATQHQIEKAFRKMALKYHPDKCRGSDEEIQRCCNKMHQLNSTMDILRDADKRVRYEETWKVVQDFTNIIFSNPNLPEWPQFEGYDDKFHKEGDEAEEETVKEDSTVLFELTVGDGNLMEFELVPSVAMLTYESMEVDGTKEEEMEVHRDDGHNEKEDDVEDEKRNELECYETDEDTVNRVQLNQGDLDHTESEISSPEDMLDDDETLWSVLHMMDDESDEDEVSY